MKLNEIIDLFLDEKIKYKQVKDMFESGELTLNDINNQIEFGQTITKLNKKYKEVMNLPVVLPYDCTWQDTILGLMYAIENKVNIEDVTDNSTYYRTDIDI